MLTGRRPFEGEGIHTVLARILNDPPPSLDVLRPGLHPDLAAIVSRALAKQVESRISGAREFAAALRAVGRGSDDRTRDFRSALPPTTTAQEPATIAPSTPAQGPESASLAVLPFSDLSPGRDQDWFCEGLAEELITALSEVSGLRVASRASTLQFRDQDPRVTGEKLQVGTLLTGSVRKAGNRVRITTQLVKVADGSVLASSRYDHDLDDVFALQEAIARGAVETVLARIGERVTPPRVHRPTRNIEAYNLYLKGRYHWNRRSVPGLRAAIPLFEQAIERDPAFAAAYVGLADVNIQLGLFGAEHPRDVAERGRELCRRALDLDPELTEARTTLATIHAIYDWDWARAESELRAVLERSPDHTRARHALALYVLAPLGRFDQAIAQMQAALAVDAVSIPLHISLAFVLHFARRSQEALTQVRATLELGSRQLLYPDRRGRDPVRSGPAGRRYRCDSRRPDPDTRATRGARPLLRPRPGESKRRGRSWRDSSSTAGAYAHSYFPALVHTGLGDQEQAIDFLERAVDERVAALVWLGVRPLLDPLRDHPRFQRLLDRLRLPNLGPPA